RGLARLTHSWDDLPATSASLAARFGGPDHPFARDLDLFGRASLMKLVDATETRFGQVHLAALLSREAPDAWPTGALARQAAARELAPRVALRESRAMLGGLLASEDDPDPAPMLTWAETTDPQPPRAVRGLAWLLPAITIGVVTIGPLFGLRAGVVVGMVVAEMALANLLGARFAAILGPVSAKRSSVTGWRAMIGAIEGESFAAPLLVTLRARFVSEGRSASAEIASFERIVSFADARQNEVFRFLLGPLLMWDAHCALSLLRWRTRAGAHLRRWLDTLGEVEALASIAAFAFEHPDFAWPDLASEPGFQAHALGHPLIAEGARVGNDVSWPSAGHAIVVTGSNMSGKSTLLRAIGVSAILAAAGAPVCAEALRIGPARVATSMRIEDSLEEGVSHFYAELRRLKGVLDRANAATRERGAPVLFLLDEILHGTNSRERIIGACAVVRELVARGAFGAVSTHDLGITALEHDLIGHVENAHFEEQVHGEAMTFDYVLRPGVVHSSNALRLMRAVGIDVPADPLDRER
ncbi:MAG: MutS-related protein, partial [Polyangiaceae bacterium]